MKTSGWNAGSIPDLAGKIVIVTGATSGIGKEAARVLASKNAKVILAVRNLEKGERTAQEIRQSAPNANMVVQALDLSSLASVKAFAEKILASESGLNLLINNAGVMVPPYSKTEDGFELQFGTNHLGHFALTGRLLPLLHATPGGRLVVVSSVGHMGGHLDFTDLNWQTRKYKAMQAYCDSKLANLYFAYELDRRLKEKGKSLRVTAAHPGWTRTELSRHSGAITHFFEPILFQRAEMGALPTLRAAWDPDAQSGDYFGPSGFLEMQGPPVKVKSNARSHDRAAAEKLWAVSEQLTGVSY
jgi:NAD(P)-dependent dehydrogenase (short-subunit alcohol dehydrogenase family)